MPQPYPTPTTTQPDTPPAPPSAPPDHTPTPHPYTHTHTLPLPLPHQVTNQCPKEAWGYYTVNGVTTQSVHDATPACTTVTLPNPAYANTPIAAPVKGAVGYSVSQQPHTMNPGPNPQPVNPDPKTCFVPYPPTMDPEPKPHPPDPTLKRHCASPLHHTLS